MKRLLTRLWAWIIGMHEHACDTCGRVWRHSSLIALGGFKSLRAQKAHTCSCGQEQWWRVGEDRGNEIATKGSE